MKTREDLTLSGLVHDLNNVFQTLVDAADLLAGDPRYAKLSSAIMRSVERGKNIAAGIQAGTGEDTPFEQILANAIAFVEDSVAAGRGPEISFACDIEPGIELGGHWAWERVLINLFLNSMRAMPAGGAIQVRARSTLGGRVVDHDELAVLRQVDVKLRCVSFLLPRQFEGSDRVFRSIERRAAVPDDLHLRRVGGERGADNECDHECDERAGHGGFR